MAIGDDFATDYVTKLVYHSSSISSAKSFNANTAAYTDETTDINNTTANDVALPPIQITTVGDAIYFGKDKFNKITLNVGTAGVYSGFTLQWQYWNGAWVALSVTDPTSFFTVAGTNNITFTAPSDWAQTAIDGVTKYWVRCVVTGTSTPSITTAPLGTQGWIEGITVWSVNAFYSWHMDIFDEQGAMDDDVPMSAQTPNAYTVINGWFINDESHNFLKEGAIATSRGDTIIALLTFQASGYTNCVSTDIGKQVVWSAVERGPLLAYNNTTRKWWVRTTASFAPPLAITITSGTGAGTATAFDNTGEDLYSNIYTLGTIESGTDIYIYQYGSKISAWWSSGHIDILVKVKEYGSEIDGAVITVYARVYTDLYDFYEIDLTAGGRNAIPLATSDDLDNATAVATILNLMDSIRIMFVNGTLPYGTKTGNDPVAHRVIRGGTSNATAHILNAPAGTSGTFTLGSIVGTFQSAETIEICEELAFDAQTAQFATLGATITGGTSAATGVLRRAIQDPQGSGTTGILFLTGITGTFADNETVSGGSGSATSNIPTGIVANTFSASTTAAVTFAATITKDLDNGAGAVPYNIVIDLNTKSVANLYELVKALNRRLSTIQTYPTNGTTTVYAYNGEFYQKANTTYSQLKKASPLGTFAGGKFFGARGIWIEDMAGGDVEDYSLIDASNATQTPPSTSTIKVVAMIASTDRVIVAESTGTGTTIVKRNQYTLTSQTNQSYIEVSGAIADDAPTSGVVRVVVDYGLATETEDIYNYTSIDRSGANDRFILAAATGKTYDSGDRAYNPYVDGLSNASGEREVAVKYSGATKYIVTKARKAGYIPFQVAGSFAAGATTVTAIRTSDGIYQP